jgi:hypothetical protein
MRSWATSGQPLYLPDWSYLALLEEDEVHVDGWIAGYGRPGNHLYVSRGVGMSRIPARSTARAHPVRARRRWLTGLMAGGRHGR